MVTDFYKLHIARKSGPYPPAAYDPSARRRIERPSTKEDMIDFVVEFLYSNVSDSPMANHTMTDLGDRILV